MDIYDKILELFGGYECEWHGAYGVYLGGKVEEINRKRNCVYIGQDITKQELEKLGELCDYILSHWIQCIRIEIIEVY